MSNQIVESKQTTAVLEFNPSQIDLIKKQIAKNATDDELQMFLYLAKQYNLDPFKKEIHFAKYKNQKTGEETVSYITARDGYLKIAQTYPDYEGLISFVVHQNDVFEIDAGEYKITHKFGAKDRGKIIGAWAKADRKGVRPQICYVDFEEYKGSSNIWTKYPSAMIQKVAEVFVLRRQFNVSGLVAREEIDYSEEGATLNYVASKASSPVIPTPKTPPNPETKQLPAPAVQDDPGKTQIIPKSEVAEVKKTVIAAETTEAVDDSAFDENIENLLNMAADDDALENAGFEFNRWIASLKVKDAGTKAEMRFVPNQSGGTAKAFKIQVNGNVIWAPKSNSVEENGGVWIPLWLLKAKQDDISK